MDQVKGFIPLELSERKQLMDALRGNVENDRAILMDRNTRFVGSTGDDIDDEEVVFAIRSIPAHYSN